MAVSVELGPKLEAYLTELVIAGRYRSQSDVVREGLRLVQEQEARSAELDAALARGLADSEAGRVQDVDEVFDRFAAKYRSAAQARL